MKPQNARTTRRQLPDEVASHIRTMIMSGQVRAGDFLRIEPLALASESVRRPCAKDY